MATKQVWTEDADIEAKDQVVLVADKVALPQLITLIHRGLYLCREQGSIGPALAEDLDDVLRIWQKMVD